MFTKGALIAVALGALGASSVPAFAMSGLGCPDLPEYYRAVGTLENGPGSCGMTTEEARRILSRQHGPSDVQQYDARPGR